MNSLEWCKQKDAYKITTPSKNLQEAYFKKAMQALETIQTSNHLDWKIIAAYYAMYYATYALLARIGVKCEIHSCTQEIAKQFLDIDDNLLCKAFDMRIQAQYHISERADTTQQQEIMRQAAKYVTDCKNSILTEKDIIHIRK